MGQFIALIAGVTLFFFAVLGLIWLRIRWVEQRDAQRHPGAIRARGRGGSRTPRDTADTPLTHD